MLLCIKSYFRYKSEAVHKRRNHFLEIFGRPPPILSLLSKIIIWGPPLIDDIFYERPQVKLIKMGFSRDSKWGPSLQHR